MTPWFLLIDERNDGVLVGVRDSIIANQLRRGVLDARLMWTRQAYDPKSDTCTGYAKKKFFVLPERALNEQFVENRRLVQLRLPAFTLWRTIIIDQLSVRRAHYPEVADVFARELRDGSTADASSPWMQDYAHAAGVSLSEAHAYAKLLVDEESHRALMIHGRAERHARAINAATDMGAIELALETMRKDFYASRT